jgi:hypothetical protein
MWSLVYDFVDCRGERQRGQWMVPYHAKTPAEAMHGAEWIKIN